MNDILFLSLPLSHTDMLRSQIISAQLQNCVCVCVLYGINLVSPCETCTLVERGSLA